MFKIPKLTVFLVVSVVLMILAYLFRQTDPLIAVSLYKAHLI